MGTMTWMAVAVLCFVCTGFEARSWQSRHQAFEQSRRAAPAAKPFLVHHETNEQGEQRQEDVVVDSKDRKLTIFNMNKNGRDSTGPREIVMDYKKDVGAIVVPKEGACYVLENLSEVYPEDQAVAKAEAGEERKKRAADEDNLEFEVGEELTPEELEELPDETRELCGQWAVHRVTPVKDEEKRALDEFEGPSRKKRWLNICFFCG